MINIVDTTSDGKVIFSVDSDLTDVQFTILDDNFEGEIFITKFEKLENKVHYWVKISSTVVSFLNKVYIQIIDSEGKEYQQYFKFKSNLLENYSLIGNSCVAWRTYEVANTVYNSPTIGNLILDDEEYVRFCEHIETYLNAEMIIGESNGNINYKKQTGSCRVVNPDAHITNDYPISHHLDIEIHWIHNRPRKLEFNKGLYTFKEVLSDRIPNDDFINKWKRRVERGKNTDKICLWSSSEMYNAHGEWERKQLIDRFKKIPSRSIFLTERKDEEFEDDLHIVKYVPEWEGNHQEPRPITGVVKWNNQEENAARFFEIIKQKFL